MLPIVVLIISCLVLQVSHANVSVLTLSPYLSTLFLPTFSPTLPIQLGEGRHNSVAIASANIGDASQCVALAELVTKLRLTCSSGSKTRLVSGLD